MPLVRMGRTLSGNTSSTSTGGSTSSLPVIAPPAVNSIVSGSQSHVASASFNILNAVSSSTLPVWLGHAASTQNGNLSFANIPNTYQHLLIVYVARDTGAGTTNAYLTYQVNNDPNADYDSETYKVVGTTATAPIEQVGGTSGNIGTVINGGATAGLMGSGFIFFPNYTGKNLVQYSPPATYRNVIGMSFNKTAGATGNINVYIHGGGWRGTGAIYQINFFPALTPPSAFSLYGFP